MCHRDIYVQYLCKRIVPNSVVDHGLRDPVSEGWHVSLTEFKGVVDGEVHREGENKDPTVESWVSSGALLRRSLTPYGCPILCIEWDPPNLVFPH